MEVRWETFLRVDFWLGLVLFVMTSIILVFLKIFASLLALNALFLAPDQSFMY